MHFPWNHGSGAQRSSRNRRGNAGSRDRPGGTAARLAALSDRRIGQDSERDLSCTTCNRLDCRRARISYPARRISGSRLRCACSRSSRARKHSFACRSRCPVGDDCIELPDTKTGGRVVPLGPEARAVLDALPRSEDNPWVIAGRLPGSHLTDLQRPWRRIRARAGLSDVRIHDLRHSFASRALALGESLTMIGKLLGHTQVQTTARYAHLARDSVQTAAAKVTGSIGGDLFGEREHDGSATPR